MRCDESPSTPYQGRWNINNIRLRNLPSSQTSTTDSDADTCDESSDDSSTDSSCDSDSDTDDDEQQSNESHRECLITATDLGKPTWLTITTSYFRWSRLIGARHPMLDIVALSYKPGQVDIIHDGDHESKKIQISESITKAKGLAFCRGK